VLRRSATFLNLHEAIQDACGWEDAHLFEFRIGGRQGRRLAGIPDREWDEEIPDARKVQLATFFGTTGGRRCLYLYDFGDGWEHEVTLRRIVTLKASLRRRLLDGQRAFPPEDCGSYPGYERCVAVARGARLTKDEQECDLKRWLGDWNPERFELQAMKKHFDC